MSSDVLYGPERWRGVEQCVKCGHLATANASFFPNAYERGHTVEKPMCKKCLIRRKKDESERFKDPTRGPVQYFRG